MPRRTPLGDEVKGWLNHGLTVREIIEIVGCSPELVRSLDRSHKRLADVGNTGTSGASRLLLVLARRGLRAEDVPAAAALALFMDAQSALTTSRSDDSELDLASWTPD